jgi:hypothetical protein
MTVHPPSALEAPGVIVVPVVEASVAPNATIRVHDGIVPGFMLPPCTVKNTAANALAAVHWNRAHTGVSGGILSGRYHTAPMPEEFEQESFSTICVTAPELGPIPISTYPLRVEAAMAFADVLTPAILKITRSLG